MPALLRIPCPTELDFSQPVILTDLMRDWAAKNWTREELARRYPDVEVILSTLTFRNQPSTLKDYVQKLGSGQHDLLYLDACAASRFPGLQEDYAIPSYCQREPLVSLWLGPAGTVTHYHKDCRWAADGNHNLLCQIEGRKEVKLVSQEQDDCMYPAPQRPGDYQRSLIRLGESEMSQFPRYAQATVYEAVLEPGETLLIPAYWWHYVRALEPSLNLTFFWRAHRVVDLVMQLIRAMAAGQEVEFLDRHRATLTGEDIRELGGESRLDWVWSHLPPRTAALATELLQGRETSPRVGT